MAHQTQCPAHFYPPNISPLMRRTAWRLDRGNFVTAMWKGTSRAVNTTIPLFPYSSLARAHEEYITICLAYLKTLPAVMGKVRDHDLPIPFRFRRALGGWKPLGDG